MKSLLIAAYSICLATSLIAVRADDAKGAKDSKDTTSSATGSASHSATAGQNKAPELTAEQKAARKELIGKYDKNNDGKLDKDERASIKEEDKAKLKKAGLQLRKKKVVEKD